MRLFWAVVRTVCKIYPTHRRGADIRPLLQSFFVDSVKTAIRIAAKFRMTIPSSLFTHYVQILTSYP